MKNRVKTKNCAEKRAKTLENLGWGWGLRVGSVGGDPVRLFVLHNKATGGQLSDIGADTFLFSEKWKF